MALLTACSHYRLPTGRFDSPEVSGASGSGRLEIGAEPGFNLQDELDPGSIDGATQVRGPSTLPKSPPLPSLGFASGWGDRMEVKIRIEASSPLMIRLQRQVLGTTEREAQKGWSASAVAGAGLLLGKSSDFQVRMLAGDIGLPIGRRWDERNLSSITPWASLASFQGPVLPAFPNGNGTPFAWGAALGHRIRWEDFYIQFELNRSFGKIGDVPLGATTAGLLLGLRFPVDDPRPASTATSPAQPPAVPSASPPAPTSASPTASP